MSIETIPRADIGQLISTRKRFGIIDQIQSVVQITCEYREASWHLKTACIVQPSILIVNYIWFVDHSIPFLIYMKSVVFTRETMEQSSYRPLHIFPVFNVFIVKGSNSSYTKCQNSLGPVVWQFCLNSKKLVTECWNCGRFLPITSCGNICLIRCVC